MRIELLRLREDFEVGFASSLTDFMAEKYKWQGRIHWIKGIHSKLEKNQSAFYANDLLNIIYPSSIERKKLAPFTKEFLYNPIFYRRILQRFYVFFAVRYPLNIFTTSATLIIENAPDEMHSWVFLPGNHSHRVIDIKKNKSLVFAKHGFNKSFLHADAEIRQQYPFLPCPAIIEYKKGQCWFTEQQITGLPINRLPNPEDRERAKTQANHAMLQLYRSTSQSVSLSEYVEQLALQIESQINIMAVQLSPTEYGELMAFSQQLCRLILNNEGLKLLNVPMALSHGDYQAANILLDGSKIWLIDWEYAGLRSLYFDCFCLLLNSRFSAGFSGRLEELLITMQDKALFESLDKPLSIGRIDLLWLFLLEEFLLKLAEVSTNQIKQKMTNISPWIKEVQAVKCFQECNR